MFQSLASYLETLEYFNKNPFAFLKISTGYLMVHEENSLFCPRMNTATTFYQSARDNSAGLLVTSKSIFLPLSVYSSYIFLCNAFLGYLGS